MALLTGARPLRGLRTINMYPPPGVKQKRASFFLTASNAVKAGAQTKSYCNVPILHFVEEEHEVV